MNIEEDPPWSKRQLRRLGESLLDKCEPPEGCPDYNTVMLWHNDLASEVASAIASRTWSNQGATPFSVTARSKTLDTLVQKLQRNSTMKLDRVQDLAGVRVDADITLSRQTQLADEIAAHFGADRVTVRDLRQTPHSGYRAVHLWLVVPAGRAEIQIRTEYQSLWANVYEGIGDLVGRGIRYDEPHPNPEVEAIVSAMHAMSAQIAHDEQVSDQIQEVLFSATTEWVEQWTETAAPDPDLIDRMLAAISEDGNMDFVVRLSQSADMLRDLRKLLNEPEGD